MPRGRKKSQSSGAPALRMVRECSEESSIAEDAPKIKDSRLEDSSSQPPVLHSNSKSPGRHNNHNHSHHNNRSSKITDFFSPSSSRSAVIHRSRSPPVLLPQVPFPGSGMIAAGGGGEADQASDRSEGDSGKENEEDLTDSPKWTSSSLTGGGGKGAKGGARPKTGSAAATSASSASSAARSKLSEKSILDQSRVVTRSRSSPGSNSSKMPLLSLSSAYSCLNPSDAVTPPPSPSKSPVAASSATSPPTPHKIKLLGSGSESSPAVSALQKLKLSFTPKSSKAATSSNKTAASKGPKTSKQPQQLPSLSPTKTSSSTTSSSTTKQQDKLSKAAASSHKVTEYFPIRRSERRPKAALDKEHLADIEHHLVADGDDHLDIVVEHFPEKGRGVVACRDFARGEFVVEYAGDLINVGMAKERESKYSLDLSTGCYMYYFKHQGKQYCIDATRESGRVGRLVNHSRQNPNLQTKVVICYDRPHLILVARKDIDSGTELLYDYGDRSKESLKAHPWLAL